MNILIGAFGQGIFIFIITLLVPILYFIAEIIGCSIFALFKKVLKRNIGLKKITKDYIFSLMFRLAVILIVCIILSLISYWNYNRIMSNPSHNKLMYVDKMDAIFANRNNEDNGLSSLLGSINSIGLPLLYVLIIINIMFNNRNKYVKSARLIRCTILILNGIILALMCYLWANAMMGI